MDAAASGGGRNTSSEVVSAATDERDAPTVVALGVHQPPSWGLDASLEKPEI